MKFKPNSNDWKCQEINENHTKSSEIVYAITLIWDSNSLKEFRKQKTLIIFISTKSQIFVITNEASDMSDLSCFNRDSLKFFVQIFFIFLDFDPYHVVTSAHYVVLSLNYIFILMNNLLYLLSFILFFLDLITAG